jgi:hypothetical protein
MIIRTFRTIVCALLPFCAFACVTGTPVTAAPISNADALQLQAALVGTCAVTGTQKPGGPIKKATGMRLIFSADGTLSYDLGLRPLVYHYRLEGRNILSDGMYKTIRVDDWSGGVLTLFLYEITQTYYCEKV